jgi:hypothetical protein
LKFYSSAEKLTYEYKIGGDGLKMAEVKEMAVDRVEP